MTDRENAAREYLKAKGYTDADYAMVVWPSIVADFADKAVADAVRERDEMLGEATSIELWIDGCHNYELRAMTGGQWRIWGGYTYANAVEAYKAAKDEVEKYKAIDVAAELKEAQTDER